MSEKKQKEVEALEPVRVRFCPSPTGDLHIGGVRTALYGWLLAQQTEGQFILRIEDTDKAREVEGGVDLIKKTLKAFGLEWDEFYLQSKLKLKHKKWAEKLYKKGLAYADNVAPEEVDAWREDARKNKKPFLYRNYITEDRIVPWVYGQNPLRLKSTPKEYKWHDEVRGDLSAGPEAIDDLILVKADGFPTYNFAHIIDDFEMEITHILRGDEFISSTPRYLNIYEALEIEPPKFVTLTPIMAPGGKKKLGKRDGAKGALEYLDEGVLVPGFLNFLALLGWNDGTEQEIFTVEELISKFSIAGIGKSGANFDQKRLEWINGHHIRLLKLSKLYKACDKFWPSKAAHTDREYRKEVLSLVQERLKYLSELEELTFFFFEEPDLSLQKLTDIKKLESVEQAQLFLKKSLDSLADSFFSKEDIQERLNSLLDELETTPAVLFALIRNAVTGAKATPGLSETIQVLGKKVVVERFEAALLLFNKPA